MPAEPSPGATIDRRDYFRIKDRIGLEIRKLAPDANGHNSPFNGNHLDDLRTELRRLDQDIKVHLASLAERDRLMTTLIKSLNGKLDILARIMAFEQNPLQPEQWQEVTLSEGGIAFTSLDGKVQVGDHVAVRMTLPPELFRPEGIVQIVECRALDDGSYWAHGEFISIHDSDRQQIARHVMRWQIRQRQK
ncbi:PilZ domain-containing protein [Marinobacter zhejiangensis]|uniref:PilZ domain-containing protein n=1 Tax=Marinobacter zhejiangensis TaxID=488535 RepID=A0A1I4RI84_9GAMM|nr:PilZ domain-containing protein [Marinobacter zhejiangensis]SFM51961.1 hypothetical protein SAMN04487963_2777 [Marinobacter zhejiangensis]